MRAFLAVSVAVSALTGCRQLFGLDDPSMRTDARLADGRAGSDAANDAQPPSMLFVQANGAESTMSSTTTIQAGFEQPVTVGDLILVVVSWTGQSAVSSVADSDANTYSPITATVTSTSSSQIVFVASGVHGGPLDVVTATFADVASAAELRIVEYRGLAASNPVDGAAEMVGDGALLASGTMLTLNAHDLLVGIDTADSVIISADSAFELRLTTNVDIIEDREVTATGSYQAGPVQKLPGPWIMELFAFVVVVAN